MKRNPKNVKMGYLAITGPCNAPGSVRSDPLSCLPSSAPPTPPGLTSVSQSLSHVDFEELLSPYLSAHALPSLPSLPELVRRAVLVYAGLAATGPRSMVLHLWIRPYRSVEGTQVRGGRSQTTATGRVSVQLPFALRRERTFERNSVRRRPLLFFFRLWPLRSNANSAIMGR